MLTRAVVLVSGGIDSAVALGWARRRYRPIALSFDVPGRPRGEARACEAVLAAAGVPHHRVSLPFLRSRADGWIAGRNLVFHAVASSLASRWRVRTVVAGHNASDARHFLDARPAFFSGLRRIVERVRIVLPFAEMTDADVALLGVRLDVPLGLTWSCYRDGARPCGRCAACRERRAALRAAGVVEDAEGGGDHGLRYVVAGRDRVLADVGRRPRASLRHS